MYIVINFISLSHENVSFNPIELSLQDLDLLRQDLKEQINEKLSMINDGEILQVCYVIIDNDNINIEPANNHFIFCKNTNDIDALQTNLNLLMSSIDNMLTVNINPIITPAEMSQFQRIPFKNLTNNLNLPRNN